MSEIKLNLLDSHTLLIATVHGSVGDALVAALSAEPETIDDLEQALKRFQKCDSIPASSLHRYPRGPIDTQPWDAGILVIDLAARMVACESTYSHPPHTGRVDIYDQKHDMGLTLHYQLTDDWIFLRSIEEYEVSCDKRVTELMSLERIDTRAILYGDPLLNFIIQNVQLLNTKNVRQTSVCRSDVNDLPDVGSDPNVRHASACRDLPDKILVSDTESSLLSDRVIDIHRRWIMTPRDDLKGNSVREILFAHRERIDADLSSRMFQWSFTLEEPPLLPIESNAYRYGGYGTHEWVMYYDLVRYLIWQAVDRIILSDSASQRLSVSALNAQTDPDPSALTIDHSTLKKHLAQLQKTWLNDPNPEISLAIPAEVIDNERRRRPEAMTGRSMVIDEDCYCCKMMGDESEAGLSITFRHFDGCNMEDEFAFSSHATLKEWEEEQRRYAEWDRERSANKLLSSTNKLLEDSDVPF